MIDTGDTAPALDLETDGGGRTSLKGRKAVVYFYPKDDTSGCTKEGQEFTALAGRFCEGRGGGNRRGRRIRSPATRSSGPSTTSA